MRGGAPGTAGGKRLGRALVHPSQRALSGILVVVPFGIHRRNGSGSFFCSVFMAFSPRLFVLA